MQRTGCWAASHYGGRFAGANDSIRSSYNTDLDLTHQCAFHIRSGAFCNTLSLDMNKAKRLLMINLKNYLPGGREGEGGYPKQCTHM
jgi:hypothetical protein